MLAETLHSFADCGNQLLLLARRAAPRKRPPDAQHPLGYGRAIYFYSFIVALLLFFGGGVFSIHEGVHKIRAPRAGRATSRVALIILGDLARARGLVAARQHPRDEQAARRDAVLRATCARPRTPI